MCELGFRARMGMQVGSAGPAQSDWLRSCRLKIHPYALRLLPWESLNGFIMYQI